MATNDKPADQVSRYLEYLPAIYQQDAQPEQVSLGRFLLAFEQQLTGLGEVETPGIEEILDGIIDPDKEGAMRLAGVHRYFDPGPILPDTERAPAEFLEWLAGWVALTLRADMDELRQRDFITRAVSLYPLRGTRQGLEQVVGIYTRLGVTVSELNTPFQIGVHSRVGVDTLLDGGAPHFFQVLVRATTTDPQQLRQYQEVVEDIINTEKPAHTYYALDIQTPTLQINVHSQVGVDTLLGTPHH